MEKKSNLSTIFAVLLVILSLVLGVGVKTVFMACPVPEMNNMKMDNPQEKTSSADKMSSGSMSKMSSTDKMSSGSMSKMDSKKCEMPAMSKMPKIMRCHWAEQAIFATGIALTVMALLMFIFKSSKERAAISASMVPVTVMAMLFPQVIIKLCMMSTMRCWTMMRPSVIGVCIVLLVIEVASVVINSRKN